MSLWRQIVLDHLNVSNPRKMSPHDAKILMRTLVENQNEKTKANN